MKYLLLVSLLISALCARAELRLHPLFSDGAVLQRDVPLPIWGLASPGEEVKVKFGAAQGSATANPGGWWLVTLPPQPASAEPRDLVVTASQTVTVRDVLVGDVWLASGQSNMDSPLRSGSAADALPTATDPLVRFFIVTKDVSAAAKAFPKDGSKWFRSTPDNARNFSAVGFFFAREIRASQNIPVAIIQTSWGGTPIRTWMSMPSIRAEPAIKPTVDEWEAALAKHKAAKGKPELQEKYFADMKKWEEEVDKPYREALKTYDADVAAAKAAGKPVPPKPQRARPEPTEVDPIAFPYPSKRPQAPSITFNAMIAPLVPYGIKGFLWYQGEADTSKAADYRVWLPRLISGWRELWGQGNVPFLLVQLPGNGKDTTPVAPDGIPFLREAQASVLKLPAVGMAVTADIGDPADVHPDNKIHTGTRLARVAREQVYGEAVGGISPTYVSHEIVGDKVHIRFANTRGGLVIGTAPWRAKNVTALPTDRVVGFYVAGEDRKWVEATATIDNGETVTVTAPGVAKPVAVRYGWAYSPKINLYTKDGAPVAPFRTDTWSR